MVSVAASGVALGDLGDGLSLIGIDLDTCRNSDGIFEPWAQEVIERFDSYTEVSPSGTGAKVFCQISAEALAEVRAAAGLTIDGREFKRANGKDHPPAIEVYVGRRYFTVTGERLDAVPAELAIIPPETLRWLLCEHGPAFAGAGGKVKGASSSDKSRSAVAFRKGAALRRSGKTFEEMREALRTDPDTSEWYAEKGTATGGRELRRIWTRAEQHQVEGQVPAFSDEHLALEFAQRHTGELRHTAIWSKWFIWTDTHWRADETLVAFDLARALCRDAASRITDPSSVKLARTIASSRTIYAVVNLARSDRAIATAHADWDADLWRFAGSATIDLRTGLNREARPDDLCTKISASAPDDRGCPLWLQFLERVTGGDKELQRYLQRVAGYCMTGATREHAMFFLYGTGANGKGVFLNTLRAIWQDYATVAPMETFIETHNDHHPTELAHLRGARLVIAQETERGRRWAESKIKALTGGDPITARLMRQDFFEFIPQFKLMIAGNHKPGLRGVDEAIRRRIHLIPFVVTIPEAERDLLLAEKLKAEWGSILQWAVEGCLAWQADGLAAPKAVHDATDKYLHDEDAQGQWIEERCAVDPIYSETSTKLYNNWKGWCEAGGARPGSQKSFSQALEERGYQKEHKEAGATFIGIALRPDQ
jgi:putative DNA primase/helicase